MRSATWLALAVSWYSRALAAVGNPSLRPSPDMSLPVELAQRARTCKQVSSCREAVELWCGGYSRADADKDGIPCENVYPTKELVDEIREEIGC